MSQSIWGTIIPSSTSGNQLATLLNDLKEALTSGYSGTSRPTELDPGGSWMDTTLEASPNFLWKLKVWTGTIDIVICNINVSTGVASLPGADGSFEVSKRSVDALGPVLSFLKERVANNGQTLIGDSLGEFQFKSAGDDDSNTVSFKVSVIASDDATVTEAGAYMVWEGISQNGISMAEWMRLKDGNLSIGIVTALERVHIKGNYKSETEVDSTLGPKNIKRKKRVSGGGQVLSGDILGTEEYTSTDSAGLELTEAVLVQASATENHTSSAQGSKYEVSIKKTGASVKTLKVVVGDNIQLKEHTISDSMEATKLALGSQDIATAASITALSSSKALVRFTGSTATSILGIAAPSGTFAVTLHNASTAVVTLQNEDAGATAADRLSIGAAIALNPGETAELFYDSTATRWKSKSGSGGGFSNAMSSQTATSGGTFTKDTTKKYQTIVAAGTAPQDTVSTTCFGAGSGLTDGSILVVVGTSDTNTFIIPQADVANGILMDGNIEFTKGKSASFMWINSLTRYVRIA
jgi:hypothetical protein